MREVSSRLESCRVASCWSVESSIGIVVSARWSHSLSCSLQSCRVVSCRVVSCRVASCRVVSCRLVSCRLFDVMSCLMSHSHVSCRVVSSHLVFLLTAAIACFTKSRRMVRFCVVSCRLIHIGSCRVAVVLSHLVSFFLTATGYNLILIACFLSLH